MILRHVLEHELPLCVEHGKAFYDSRKNELGGVFDPQKFLEFWTRHYMFDSGVIIGAWDGEILRGGFGGVLVSGEYDGIVQALERFLWLPHGGFTTIRLIEAFEVWARSQGARSVDIGHFADTPRVGKLYGKLGYVEQEHFHRKVL